MLGPFNSYKTLSDLCVFFFKSHLHWDKPIRNNTVLQCIHSTTTLNILCPSAPSSLHLFSLMCHSSIHLLPAFSRTPVGPFISLIPPPPFHPVQSGERTLPHLIWFLVIGGEMVLAAELRRGQGEFHCPQPCKLDCQNFTAYSIISRIKANALAGLAYINLPCKCRAAGWGGGGGEYC